MRAVMLLDNHHGVDRRVAFESSVLGAAGLDVRVVAWDRRPGALDTCDEVSGAQVVRVPVPCPPGGGTRSTLAVLSFSRRVWKRRAEWFRDADVLIAHDVYVLPLGRALSHDLGVPLVYDAHEEHEAQETGRYSRWMLRCIKDAETLLAQKATAVVVPGEARAERWRPSAVQLVVLRNIGTVQPTPDPQTEPDRDMVYCGMFLPERRLDLLLEFARRRPDLAFTIAGRGRGEAELRHAAAALPNVELLGWAADPDAVLRRGRVVYYGQDPSHPYSELAAPNTLFQACRLRRPLIFFCGGEVRDTVARYRVGVRCTPTLDDLERAWSAAQSGPWEFDAAWRHLLDASSPEAFTRAVIRAAESGGANGRPDRQEGRGRRRVGDIGGWRRAWH